jgi:molecular chaperone GrpE
VTAADDENDGQATERVVIRDRRKIDAKGEPKDTDKSKGKGPAGGAHRAADPEEPTPAPPAEEAKPGPSAELEALRTELDERTHDLQRVTAEYANYRKRVDRDRNAAAEQTTGAVLTALLPVLDDIDRAREHGDLVGPFASVAESLTAMTGKFGLVAFGEKGEPFDPNRHEAVAHQMSADVSEPTCVEVMRRGYSLGERLLRPAMVAVADPE